MKRYEMAQSEEFDRTFRNTRPWFIIERDMDTGIMSVCGGSTNEALLRTLMAQMRVDAAIEDLVGALAWVKKQDNPNYRRDRGPLDACVKQVQEALAGIEETYERVRHKEAEETA